MLKAKNIFGIFGKSHREPWLLAAALFACWLVLFLMHLPIQPYSDDIVYMQRAQEMGLFSFLGDFYMTWSGRIGSNALCWLLLGQGFALWKILNPLVIIALCYGAARVFCTKVSLKNILIALLFLFALGPGVLDYAVFWATGSLYYLWPVAVGMFVIMPFLDMRRKTGGEPIPPQKQAQVSLFVLRILAALFVGMCNEQLSACLLGFMALILAEHFFVKKRIAAKHLIIFACVAASFLVMMLAPGGGVRYAHEAQVFSDIFGTSFADMSAGERILRGVNWMYSAMFFSLYLVLLLVFALSWHAKYYGTSAQNSLLKQKPPRCAKIGRGLKYPLLALLCVSVLISFPTRIEYLFTLGYLHELDVSQGVLYVVQTLLPYAYWTLFLAGIFYLLFCKNAAYALGLFAALCTLAVMVLSPTLYFSGERTLFVAGVLLVIIMLGLVRKKMPAPLLVAVLCLVGFNTVRLVSRLSVFYG